MPPCSLVITTVDTQEAADRLIARVLDDRLAACVQVHAVASHYVWKGERQCAPELLLQMKIKTADYEALAQAIREVHPYETPEIVRLPIEAGDPRYLAWIGEVTR
jgi:periplasmic divalent cation tolerance protein